MKTVRSISILIIALVLAAVTAPGALAQRSAGLLDVPRATAQEPDQATAASEPFVSFLPRPDQVFLQKSDLFPGFGNALVFVQLSRDQANELLAETGRDDFVVLGAEGEQTILRDDGQGGDPVAGDHEFTGVITVDEAELAARGEEDSDNASRSATVPTFEGRVFVGDQPAKPFDADGFLAGAKVELTEPVELLSSSVSTSSGSGVALVGSDGERAPVAGKTHPDSFQHKVLMITDLGVVRDPSRTFDPCNGGNPNGVWTFKHLVTEMANQPASGIDPAVFTERWLQHWLNNQTINSFTVQQRLAMGNILNNWPRLANGNLDLDQSPLRLLAIVSRLDLATTRGGGSGYGTSTGDFLDAGEARFVFGFVTGANGCTPTRFSVIFEYRVPKCTCDEVRSWAGQWVDLANYTLGSTTYNARLERLTEQFVRAGANPTRPNGSAIGQVRTNEIHLASPWELREFQLDQMPFSFLNEKTTADSPHDSFNGGPGFADWVRNGVIPGLPNNVPTVPLFFAPHGNFQGANPQPPTSTFFWDEPGLDVCNLASEREGRFTASFNSCNGCHAGETGTPFVHVDPATPQPNEATLSGFLTGITVNDPAMAVRGCGPFSRTFDDLDRRELDIRQKARMSCFETHPVAIDAVRTSLANTGSLPPNLFGNLSPQPPARQLPITFDPLIGNFVIQVH